MSFSEFFLGSPGKYEQVSKLDQSQQPIYSQLTNAAKQKGAGGVYGTAADYYRSLFEDDNDTYRSLANPEMRRFNEEIIPDLAEQFAGMGSGGLSSSSFRNAGIRAGTDLSERLAALRANLRQQGAEGLMNLGNQSLQSYNENIYRPASKGLLDYASQAAGMAAGAYFGNPAAFTGMFGGMGSSNPYEKAFTPTGSQIATNFPRG